MNKEKNFIDIEELSTALGIKASTLYAWIHRRKIPYYKIGRLVKFKLEEVEEWIQKRHVASLGTD